ncbi:MAG: ABC transporter ATP-binding protein [Acidobacteriota bacterium]|nr:ABC transporter ATP-binding protein [Acidobacteriota bacterium]
MSFLKLENLSKRCDDNWILRDISLEIEPGEIFGLLGPTGAGKSILLRLIAGDDLPDSGTISKDGTDITRFSPQKRDFLTLFQNAQLSHRSSVAENIALGLKSRKISKEEVKQKTANVLKSIGLSDFELLRADELSDGHQLLVALAGSVVQEPQLLLLDAPFSNLDPKKRDSAFVTLRNLTKESGTTIIFATQNQEDAFAFCDRVAILGNGEIQQSGAPIEIYTQPENVAVAAFFGRNNLIRAARLNSNKEALSEFQTIEGSHRLFVDKVEKRKLGAINQIVTLVIRPENLILTFGAAFPEDNLLRAVVTEINYFGATTRIRLDADGLKLEALVIRLIGLNVGDVCLVGLPPNRIQVLKD